MPSGRARLRDPRAPHDLSRRTASAAELEARRAFLCRLTPDRALESIDEAAAFLEDRGMLTLTLDSSLPSLFEACHEEPYKTGSRGFGLWPKTKYPWAFELAARALAVLLHRGKTLYLSRAVAVIVDPLCRAGLAEAEEGTHGRDAQRLVRHLAKAGPSLADDLKLELGLDPKRLRAARLALECVGALVSLGEMLPAGGGHVHASRIYRWDQRYEGRRGKREAALDALLVAGVRAAVLAPEREVARWFSWRPDPGAVDRLVADRALRRPAPGWVAAP